ncbi:carbamoyl phosphate synthase-like protein [mine drainage metagenome]|uniref:Carbamoyl phosphate synthase-like protein n=1 Tax=mine drainage metagenome TaxID=410659 RepID=A0A1J5T1Z1_9ZZZZ
MWVVYFPVSFYYAYLSVRARSLFFFSASNPTIETGGMFFESKWKIFQLIPTEYFPPTIFIDESESFDLIEQKMKNASISFPVIAKPDRGERGWMVKKINSISELEAYHRTAKISFLIQSYINYPLEFSIFYYRNPNSENGIISSVTFKKLLTVTGDGISTVDELIKKNNRAFLQYKKLKQNKQIDFDCILKHGEAEVLVPYGNHVRGAMFLDYNHIIDKNLIETFNSISKKIKGFYFGRFDLRCSSIEDLKQGKNISILELNGAGAEPAHIYDPGFSFFKAQLVLAKHYKMMFQAASENKKRGIEYMTYQLYRNTKKSEKEYKQKASLI